MTQIKASNNDKIQSVLMINKTLYNTVALGGTFDHLHEGHKQFLLFAAEISQNLIIGVTDQQMTLTKQHSETIQPTHVRKQAVANFCNQHGIQNRVITIFDPFGPTIEENSRIQAIVCTTETLAGANKINEIRDKLHMHNLPIHVHTLKKDQLGIDTISAERIRNGEIDRTGRVYASVFNKTLTLSEKSREFFSKLHGTIISKPTQSEVNSKIIVVGDSTLETFIQNNWKYDLGIFDGKRQRKEYNSEILNQLQNSKIIGNTPGSIEQQAVQIIMDWKSNQNFRHIFIEGEEDLLAVATILLMPLGTQVYYGQPNQGIVECVITEDIKETFFDVLSSN